jgi:hypothetical protein
MKNHDAQIGIQKQHKERQEKFVYYLIALCVAAIGFSVTQTVNQQLNYFHVLLGVSFACWATSIFCGFQFIQLMLLGSQANNHYFNTLAGHVEGIKPSPANDKIAADVLREKSDKYSTRSQRNFMWQQYLFYLGLGSFIAWHIIQMTKN